MKVQRYDVRDAAGDFAERHWRPINTPIFDDTGRLLYLLHHVADVTAEHLRAASFSNEFGKRPPSTACG
jgi:hypothetical protein